MNRIILVIGLIVIIWILFWVGVVFDKFNEHNEYGVGKN